VRKVIRKIWFFVPTRSYYSKVVWNESFMHSFEWKKRQVIFLFDFNSPTPDVGFLFVAPKVACIALITQIFNILFPFSLDQWYFIIKILVISNIILGNSVAITQMSMKCMLAYSSINQIGYLMIEIIVGNHKGYASMMIYLLFIFLQI